MPQIRAPAPISSHRVPRGSRQVTLPPDWLRSQRDGSEHRTLCTSVTAVTNMQVLDTLLGKELWISGERKAPWPFRKELVANKYGPRDGICKIRPATKAQGLDHLCLGQNERPLAASAVCHQIITQHAGAQIWGMQPSHVVMKPPPHQTQRG